MPSLPPGPYTHNGSAPGLSHNLAAAGGDSNSTDEAMSSVPPSYINDPNFDILEWHPAYQSCQRYFLDHAQHEQATQAVCALINIRLPFQWLDHPVSSSSSVTPSPTPGPTSAAGGSGSSSSPFAFNPYPRPGGTRLGSPSASRGTGRSSSPNPAASSFVSAVPYIRRLVVTGFDKAGILHGFFGDDWAKGVGPFVECERRNYLFAAKGGGWRSCKRQYDLGSRGESDETVPFMKSLDGVSADELNVAEKAWSNWLAMEDWMVGPRAPDETSADNNRTSIDGGRRGNADMVDGEVDGYR